MSDDALQHIQSLQFDDKPQAEALLVDLIGEMFDLEVASVELRPLAVSLNSFNGFVTLADGQRYFFKTHTEPDSVIGEYYNSSLMAEAGYKIIQPVFSSTDWGKQLLMYAVIEDPSVFDVAWEIEQGNSTDLNTLTQAQQAGDRDLYQRYTATLDWQDAGQAADAKVHQLFYHRITGGRLARFYGPLPGDEQGAYPQIHLPNGACSMATVRQACWIINGQRYDTTLDSLTGQAIELLQPAQAGPAIVGHGDAHNGNVFLRRDVKDLLYFDPAFAGRHHPLLDLTKPLFHNVFAMWMYFPQEKAAQLDITLERDDEYWQVEHDYALHPVRQMFWESKVEQVVLPILRELKRRDWLRPDWRAYLKAALFCCPFLTMNLSDSNKFSPAISLLGLAYAVEMGAESLDQRSMLDATLDKLEARLSEGA